MTDIKPPKAQALTFKGLASGMNLAEIFPQYESSHLNRYTLYLAYFNRVPNQIHEVKIDCRKAYEWFSESYRSDIIDFHYNKRYLNKNGTLEYDDIFCLLKGEVMVVFDTNQSNIFFLFQHSGLKYVESIIKSIKDFPNSSRGSTRVSLLVKNGGCIDLKAMVLPVQDISIEDNYNDDFADVHQNILIRLSEMNDKGLVLLHGKPGTGKTSYIKYLMSEIDKDIIFLPPNMAEEITNPELISLFITNPNSILVIEDSENIIIDREVNGNSAVSTLLNISDGILSDCLNIQIICSFNTDISRVDKALLRKGRLIAKYEFKELETSKAQALSRKFGMEAEVFCPMTLGDIYNQEEKSYVHESRLNTIGFKSGKMVVQN